MSAAYLDECHICHLPLTGKGEWYCSAAHNLSFEPAPPPPPESPTPKPPAATSPETEGELYDRLLAVAGEVELLAAVTDDETASMLRAGKMEIQRATGLWLGK